MSFNSTMVRLKDVSIVTDGNDASFNSTMVRLKANPIHDRHHPHLCFNSTMVRLKAVRGIHAIDVAAALFQFHNGSIKSHQSEKERVEMDGFQFHNGSIKSVDETD